MIAFDTETTGLLKPDVTNINLQPHIIEIYLCKFNYDGKIIDEFETYLKPPIPLPEIITKITGIEERDLKNAPTFIEIYDDLSNFVLGETEIFAHNCSFDIGMVSNELKRVELENRFPWPMHHRCTVELSYPIKNRRLKLEQLFKIATGRDMTDQHRAKFDVLATVECIIWLKKNNLSLRIDTDS